MVVAKKLRCWSLRLNLNSTVFELHWSRSFSHKRWQFKANSLKKKGDILCYITGKVTVIIHRSMSHSPGAQNRGLKTIHLSVHPSLITVSLRAGFTLTVTRSLYISRNVAADCSSFINPGFTYPRKSLDWSHMVHMVHNGSPYGPIWFSCWPIPVSRDAGCYQWPAWVRYPAYHQGSLCKWRKQVTTVTTLTCDLTNMT